MNIHHSKFSQADLEKQRIETLYRYGILDTPSETSFDNITLLASKLLNAPISLISFVDKDRIWCKSHLGTEIQNYERIEGFCSTAIHYQEPYIVNDACMDPRCKSHPLVKKTGVRFYAGVQLKVSTGDVLGTLCVIDFQPRQLSSSEIETLTLLANMAIDAIELHAKNHEVTWLHNNLRISEQHFRSVFEQAGVGVSIANAETGTFIATNKKYCDIVGYSQDELEKINLNSITHPDDLPEQKRLSTALLAGEISEYIIQKRYIRKDRTLIWVNLTCTALWLQGEKPTEHLAIVENINDKKMAELALKESEERWGFALEGANQGVWDLNLVSNQIFLSPRCKEMLGYEDDQISSNMDEWVKLIHPEDLPCLVSARLAALTGETRSFENEHRKYAADGTWHWIYVTGMVVQRDENNMPIRVIGTYTDITERKNIEAEVVRLAHYDGITNLPNRALFMDRLNQELKKSNRSNKPLALMMLDLDRFKEVNDTLGHQKGDLLIKLVGERLLRCIRETDTLGRLGGDEFMILLTDLHQLTDVEVIAHKILNCVAEPCELDGELAYITASIGITLYPYDSLDMDSLFKQADQAMYAAKNAGKNRYSYFTPTMQKAAVQKVHLTNHLRNAVTKNELRLLYQPIIDLQTGQIHKAEALIRWQHPEQGVISPALFIPIAEESGLIYEIGEWVFRQAVEAIQICRENIHPEFQISINKSPVQFRTNFDQHHTWIEHLTSKNLPGSCLVVEITEGILLDKSENLDLQLQVFRDSGVQIALDDFGTGYSSLIYLKQYDIDYIKIDQAFVKNLASNSEDHILCQAIIAMAHAFRMKVIAEGVETVQQMQLLQTAGCDYAQGYYFAKPMPLEEMMNSLSTN
jgi:diguanylate cyclase (GGDEF)-like protein/PAS domain S-box-containing protein